MNEFNQFKEAYRNYKKGHYDKKMYIYGTEIRTDLKNGKLFVLKEKVLFKTWLMLFVIYALIWASVIWMLFYNYAYERPMPELETILILGSILFDVFLTLFTILMSRGFVVIGMQGVYYKVYWMKRHFEWSQVQEIGMKDTFEAKYRYLPNVAHVVKVGIVKKFAIVLEGNKTRYFNYKSYKNKEFPKKQFKDFFKSIFFEALSLNYDLAEQ